MAHTFLIFDFGTNEDAAQQARHKIEGWKQAFRLGNKILLKFDREETVETAGDSDRATPESEANAKGKSSVKAHAKRTKTAKFAKPDASPADGRVRVLIRLDFSDHEKLSLQRWAERIPNEEPFRSAKGETIKQGEAAFVKTSDLFDSLD